MVIHCVLSVSFQLQTDGEFVSRADAEEPPADVVAALAGLTKHSLKVTEAAKPERLRAALDALSRKLNGKPAADNTVNRKRMVLSNAMRYAIEKDILSVNPPRSGRLGPSGQG